MNFVFYLHDEKSHEEFERKLLWFKSRYNLVGMQDIREHIHENRPLKNACMLSVDDGWRSTYDIIFPIMKKHNVPFTIFVSPEVMEAGMNFWYYTMRFCNEEELKDSMIRRGLFSQEIRKYPIEFIFKEIQVDEIYDVLAEYQSNHSELSIPRGFMNTQEVLELHKSSLVEVGSHTVIHPILANETEDRSCKEIQQSVARLSDLLDYEVKTLAYPNGMEGLDYGKREQDYAKSVGIDMAFSVDPGVICSNTNPLSIPRWGSTARLKFGRLGMYLPSRMNQAKIRKEIHKYKLK